MNRRAAENEPLSVTPARGLPGLAISGEIDEANYGDPVAALERFAENQGEIHVDIAGVKYCDLAGLRAIVTLAWDGVPTGRRVVLHHVLPHLHEILRILGWDAIPGLTVDEGSRSPVTPHAHVAVPPGSGP